MTYEEALKYIHSKNKFGSDLGLDRITKLLQMLGNPQDKLKFVHVAGTNGKGSTTAMIASVLKTAGYKTGMYISPFVERFNERIQINFQHISDEALSAMTEKVKDCVEQLDSLKLFSPVTEFELVTAIGFCYFELKQCDFVVLEVGLGGRLDATNVIKTPLVAVITSISLDHTQILGNTLYEIAGEKAGIIKEKGSVVLYPKQDKEVFKRIDEAVVKQAASLTVPDLSMCEINDSGLGYVNYTYKGLNIYCNMSGEHQVYNGITAIEALNALSQKGVNISDEHIKKGIEDTRFIGRLQFLRKAPNIIIDAGHNADGVETLAVFLEKHIKHKGGSLYTIMGMLADKDYRYCIRRIASLSDEYFAVRPDNPRALSPKDNCTVAQEYCNKCYAYENLKMAIDEATAKLKPEDTLVVCGSLYMIGHALQFLNN